MRVLFITPRFEKIAGEGLYAVNLAHALVDTGIDVHVLSVQKNRFVHFGIDRVHELNLINVSQEQKQNVITMNYYSRMAKIFLENILKNLRFDCIHVHSIHQYFTLSSILSLKNYKIPIVMTIHDYKVLCGNAGFFSNRTNRPCISCLTGSYYHALLEKCKDGSLIKSCGAWLQMEMWRYVDFVKSVTYFHVGSEFVYNLLNKNTSFDGKLKLIRLPFFRKEDLNLNAAEENRIGYIGRFVPHKGIGIFAEAVKELNVPIHIYGDGPEKGIALKILKDKQNVFFHGWQSRENIYKTLNLGSIVIVPYLTLETFCYVVLEAMMCGCCVVASNRGAIAEFIKDGVNGILINDPKPASFRQAVIKLLANPSEILSIGTKASKIDQDLMGIKEHTEEIVRLYFSALQKESL